MVSAGESDYTQFARHDVNTSNFEAAPMFLPQLEETRSNFYFFRGPTASEGAIFSVAITRNGETLGAAIPVSELNFGDPGVTDGVTDARATVRFDGKEVVFFSTRPGGLGQADLYVSMRRDIHSPWSTPVNLGAPINTSDTDTQPSLSFDGETLLFSSNRPGGLGNNDIWMSTRKLQPQ